MTQIWLFIAGCGLGVLGVLASLVFAAAGSSEPRPGIVLGLVMVTAGLALTVAGACVG